MNADQKMRRVFRRWKLFREPLQPGYRDDWQTYRLTVGGEVWSEGFSMAGVRNDAHRGMREQRRLDREAMAFPVADHLVKRFGMDSPQSPFPLVAWPGCYPLVYIDSDGGELCPACANKHRSVIVGGDVYWEGPALVCDECYALIESAYGDPEVEVCNE